MTAQPEAPVLAAGTWSVSDSRTRVGFAVGNLGRTVHGSMALSRGDVGLDGTGSPVHVRAELDLEALCTGISRRDADLRKPRFLDIDRQPVMTWTCDRFTPAPGGGWTADGELHVRGTSAPLRVVGTPEVAAAGWVRVRAWGELDRTAVGIRAPGFLVGRMIRIDIDAWLRPAHEHG